MKPVVSETKEIKDKKIGNLGSDEKLRAFMI